MGILAILVVGERGLVALPMTGGGVRQGERGEGECVGWMDGWSFEAGGGGITEWDYFLLRFLGLAWLGLLACVLGGRGRERER